MKIITKRQYAVLKEILAGSVLELVFFPRDTLPKWKEYVDVTLTKATFNSLQLGKYIEFKQIIPSGITRHIYEITQKGKDAVIAYEIKNGSGTSEQN